MSKKDFDPVSLFDASPNPYLILDRSLHIVGANKAYLKTTKRELTDIVGRLAWEAFPTDPQTLKQTIASVEQAILTKQPDTIALLRYDIPRPEAEGGGFEKRYWSTTHTPILNEEGEVAFIMQHPIDVTELERLRQAMPADNQEQGSINLFPAVSGLFSHAQSVYQANFSLMAESDRLRRLRAILGVRDSRIHHWTDEEVILAEEVVDRTWLALERAYAEEKRVRAEEALRKIAKRQELLIDTADLLHKTSDRNTICCKSSEILVQHFQVSRVLFGEYHVVDKTITFHSNYTDGTVSEVNGTIPAVGFGTANLVSLENGITWVGDDLSTDPRTSGPETWQTWEALHIYSAVGVPLSRQGEMVACLFISHNKPRHWSCEEVRLIEDVAERIWNALERLRSEEALKQADRHKDEFLAMLAHELRNPLAPIGSAAEYLYSAQLNEQQVRQASEVIVRQVEHMTNLVNDLLDVARVTKGLVKLNNRPLDIRHIMGEAVEQATPLIQARGQHLMLQHAKDPMIVMGDRERLIQVVTNLINNAVKYTHEGGNIQVQATVRDEQVLLEVIDDGIGMAPEVISYVFDLFAQAEVSLNRSAGGLGIGLSLVKALVKFHGGTVSCQSDGMGKGSTFSILLPRIEEAAQAMPQPQETRLQKPKQPLRILIVDDHVQAAKMLAMLLEALGHEVLIEHSSRRALERATLERPDVCLLDIGMPEMDGNELAQSLRAQTPTAKSVLIAVTGYGHERDREKSSAAGFDHHLVKPVDTKKLTSILAKVAKA